MKTKTKKTDKPRFLKQLLILVLASIAVVFAIPFALATVIALVLQIPVTALATIIKSIQNGTPK